MIPNKLFCLKSVVQYFMSAFVRQEQTSQNIQLIHLKYCNNFTLPFEEFYENIVLY